MTCFLCGCDTKGISHLPVVDGNSYTVCDMCFLKPIILQNINKKIVFKKAEDAREEAKKEAAEYVEIVKKIANSPPPISQEVIDKLSKSQEEYEKGDTVYTKCGDGVKYIAVDFKTVNEINLKNENEKLKKKIRNQRAELRRLNRKVKDYDKMVLLMTVKTDECDLIIKDMTKAYLPPELNCRKLRNEFIIKSYELEKEAKNK